MAVLGRFFEAFDLGRALRFGLVPLVWQQAAYASLYLQQEVRAEALVRDVGWPANAG